MFKRAMGSTFRRNVSWQMIGTASQAVLSGLILIVMGRELRAAGFGQYSIILGFVTVANLLVEPRMQDVAARQFWDIGSGPQQHPYHRQFFIDLLIAETLLKLLPCLAVVALSGVLARMAHLPPGSQTLVIIASVGNYLAKAGYGLSTGLLRVLGRSDQFTYCGSGEMLVRLLCMLALAGFVGLTVANCLITLSLTLMVSNVVQFSLAVKHVGGLDREDTHWRLKGLWGRLRGQRKLLISNIGLSAADLMNKDLDVTILSPFVAAGEIGVYKMAKNFALLTWRAVDPFYLALMPELNRRIQLRDIDGARALLRRSAIGLAILALTLCASAYLVVLVFGQALLGPAFAAIPTIIVWMLVGVVVSAPLVWGHPLAVALNRGDIPLIGSLLGLAIGLASFFTLAPELGTLGAAISWSLSFTPHFLFTSTTSYRLFRQQWRSK
jgi:hypothetical protein